MLASRAGSPLQTAPKNMELEMKFVARVLELSGLRLSLEHDRIVIARADRSK